MVGRAVDMMETSMATTRVATQTATKMSQKRQPLLTLGGGETVAVS